MTFEEMKQRFCARIQELRKQKEISLRMLSQKSGISLEMLEQLEQNILPEEMMVGDAIALARVFHCKVYELFE